MWWQTVGRFCILARETFPNSITLTLIIKYAKGAVVTILTVLGLFTKLLFEGSSETGISEHLYNHGFAKP